MGYLNERMPYSMTSQCQKEYKLITPKPIFCIVEKPVLTQSQQLPKNEDTFGSNQRQSFGSNQRHGLGSNQRHGFGSNQRHGLGSNQRHGFGSNQNQGFGNNQNQGFGKQGGNK